MMEELKPYPEYRDTGEQWLGGIPKHWDIKPGIAAFRQKQVKNIGMQEKTVLSLSYGRIVIKPREKLHGLVPESFETYQIGEPGDIIIRSTDLQNDWKSLRVGMVRNRGIITSAYLCLYTTSTFIPEYGYLLLHAFDLMKVFYGMGSGLRQNLAFKDLKKMLVFVPPKPEQKAIVRFLDHFDRLIRYFIKLKQRQIRLLEEQKQKIIHHSIIKSINPNVRFKPSGIDWLGEIPNHWKIVRNSRLFVERIEKGRSGLPILVVSLRTGVTEGSDKNEKGKPKRLISNFATYKYADTGDIAYNMMRMWQGAVGVVPTPGLVSPAYVVAKPLNGVFSRYFEYLFRTDACKGEINRNSRGIVSDRNRLYWDQFKRLCLPLPPFEEQKEIVDYISSETDLFNKTILHLTKEINYIKEYRTRFISDVVTGKLDVRTLAESIPEKHEGQFEDIPDKDEPEVDSEDEADE